MQNILIAINLSAAITIGMLAFIALKEKESKAWVYLGIMTLNISNILDIIN